MKVSFTSQKFFATREARLLLFFSCTLLLFCTTVPRSFCQSNLSRNTLPQPIATPRPPQSQSSAGLSPCASPVTLSHSTSQSIVALNSISCNAASEGHTDNSYWRAFSLVDAFNVSAVQIGIEEARSSSGTQSITVRIHQNSGGTFPAGTRTLIATANYTVADQSLTVVSIPITASLPANSVMVVEIFTPNGQFNGNFFFIGSNALGQSAPSYIQASSCGVTEITNLAALGFPDMHIVMNVVGCPAVSCTAPAVVSGTTPSVSTHYEGSAVSFSASATGTDLTVKWQKNNMDVTTPVPYTAGTMATHNTTLARADSGATFRAVFANTCGTATSTAAKVHVNPKPSLTQSTLPSICVSGLVSHTATSTLPNVQLSWTRAAVPGISQAASSGNSGVINETLTNTSNTQTTVAYVFKLVLDGNIFYQTLTVRVNPIPSLNSSLTPPAVNSGAPFVYTLFAHPNFMLLKYAWTRPVIAGISNSMATGSGIVRPWNPAIFPAPSILILPVQGQIRETLINTTNAPITVIYTVVLDLDGCQNTQRISVVVMPSTNPDIAFGGNATNGRNQTATQIGLSVYPNPVSDLLTVDIAPSDTQDGDCLPHFQMLNLLGQTVMQGKLKQQLPVSTLSKGSYILRVGKNQVKFMKQ